MRHIAELLIRSNLGPVTVIIGFEAPKIMTALMGLKLKFQLNPNFASGQMSSVQCGIQNLNPDTEGAMIALADMPGLTPWDYQTIVRAFEQQKYQKIIIPYFAGERGNPILLPERLFKEISSGSLKAGCRRLIETRPLDVHRLEVTNPSHTTDIDTPHDYSNWQQQFIVLPACC